MFIELISECTTTGRLIVRVGQSTKTNLGAYLRVNTHANKGVPLHMNTSVEWRRADGRISVGWFYFYI